MVKRRKKLSVRRRAKKSAKVKVKEVVIAPTEIIRVIAPPGVVPVVAVDPVRRTVEVVPVTKTKKLSWWQSLFR